MKGFTSVKNAVSNIFAPRAEQSFAQKLTARMPHDRNYIVSPLSLKTALAMAANGAVSTARQEILDALGTEGLGSYNGFMREFSARFSQSGEIETANSIWLNAEYFERHFGINPATVSFAPDFKRVIRENYGGIAGEVNYKNAVNEINGSIAERTRGKISGVISDPDFPAALVNTVYMNARWVNRFPAENTMKDTFTDRNGKTHSIDFMSSTFRADYWSGGGTAMGRLPYKGGGSMTVVLGDSTRFETKRGSMTEKKVCVSMPKFKIENTFELKDTLADIGVKSAFDPRAGGFDAMLAHKAAGINVFLDKVIQKTRIVTAEEGTEAAAATVVAAAVGCAPGKREQIIEFKADKPFSFYICDDASGEILFMGEYAFA